MRLRKTIHRRFHGLAALAASFGVLFSAPAAFAESSCGYLWEWVEIARFPLQPTNGWAAYSYLIQHNDNESIGYVMEGAFPYGTYTGWDIYGEGGNATALMKAAAMVPEPGSQNPYVPGTPMLAENRDFRLLILPETTDRSTLPASLRLIQNVLETPASADADSFVLAIRLYGALPGYNLGGYGGPDDLDFPKTTAVNLATGNPVDCTSLSLLGDKGRQPDDMPVREEDPDNGNAVHLTDLDKKLFLGGPTLPRVDGDVTLSSLPPGLDGFEFAPVIDPTLIQFTRPPLAPGAGVPSVPPPDSCSGYLGAGVDPDQIALIRVPRVPSFLSNKNVTPETLYEQEDVQFYGVTMYGSNLGLYLPGSPYTNSLGNETFMPDRSGGSTILVWPRRGRLSAKEQNKLFRKAARRGWVLLRGGEENAITTANILVRQKGAAADYSGGFEPTDEVSGVPCFFDDSSGAWSSIDDATYVASPSNMGAAAPQGVYCTSVTDVLKNRCERRLRRYIRSTGGRYRARPTPSQE